MQKIKNIEFLRVIGCIAVIIFHLFCSAALHGVFGDIKLYDKLFHMTFNGQNAVDLFFILSGFFFALKLNTTKSLWEFLKAKLIRLWPVLIFSILLCFIASLFGTMKFNVYDNILDLCGLGGTSLVLKPGNMFVFWYVSAMLWTLILFYYLLKNYEKKNVNLFIASLIFFCYSFIIHAKGGRIDNYHQTFDYIYNIGMMRAFAGIGLGYFIAEWYKNNIAKINSSICNLKQKLSLTALEFMCIFFIINNLMFHNPNCKNQLIYIVVFAVTIILFLIKRGFISQCLENNFWVKLSKYTYSFYMTHFIVYNILKGSLWKYHSEWVYAHPILNIEFALYLVFLLGIFTYHFVEEPCANYFKKKAHIYK